MNDDIDIEVIEDCTDELKALSDLMMSSNPDAEFHHGTVEQVGLRIFKLVANIETAICPKKRHTG